MISLHRCVSGTFIVFLQAVFNQREAKKMETSKREDICHAIEIARDLIGIANRNEKNCENDTCLLAYGIIRDCGYNIIRIVGDENCNQHVF